MLKLYILCDHNSVEKADHFSIDTNAESLGVYVELIECYVSYTSEQ